MDENQVAIQPTLSPEQEFKRKNFKRNLWTYSAGGIGRDFAYSSWSTSLLTFSLLTRGLDAKQFALLSVIIIVCRIWDAINDPVMGIIVERTRGKWGKFKPWIMIGVITNSAVIVAMFTTKLQGMDFVIFFIFAYLLWDVTFTMNDIGYWAMLPSLTSDEKDRNTISSLANVLAGLGSGGAFVVVPMITTGALAIGGSAVSGYKWASFVVAILFIGCQTMTSLCVKEYPLPPVTEKTEKTGFKKMIKVIKGNGQLQVIALVMLIYNLGSTIVTGMGAMFIYFKYGYNGTLAAVFTTIPGVVTGVMMLLYGFLSKKYTRNQILKIAVICSLSSYALMLVCGLAFPANMLGFAIFTLVSVGSAAGNGMFYMVLTLGITNCIEYNEWKTGSRDEGIIFSVRPFMAKMGSSLQMLVIGAIYLIVGLTAYTNQISEVENWANLELETAKENGTLTDAFTKLISDERMSRINGIVDAANGEANMNLMLALMVIIPIILIALAYFVFKKKYIINEDLYKQMTGEINAKAAEAASAEPATEA